MSYVDWGQDNDPGTGREALCVCVHVCVCGVQCVYGTRTKLAAAGGNSS